GATKGQKGLVRTEVRAEDCLFAAAGNRSLVHLEGLDGYKQMEVYFAWTNGKHNAFSGYQRYLDVQPPDPVAMELSKTEKEWQEFINESNPMPRFAAMRFEMPAWNQIVPDDFKPKQKLPELVGYGAMLDTLPRPNGPKPMEPVLPDETEKKDE